MPAAKAILRLVGLGACVEVATAFGSVPDFTDSDIDVAIGTEEAGGSAFIPPADTRCFPPGRIVPGAEHYAACAALHHTPDCAGAPCGGTLRGTCLCEGGVTVETGGGGQTSATPTPKPEVPGEPSVCALMNSNNGLSIQTLSPKQWCNDANGRRKSKNKCQKAYAVADQGSTATVQAVYPCVHHKGKGCFTGAKVFCSKLGGPTETPGGGADTPTPTPKPVKLAKCYPIGSGLNWANYGECTKYDYLPECAGADCESCNECDSPAGRPPCVCAPA